MIGRETDDARSVGGVTASPTTNSQRTKYRARKSTLIHNLSLTINGSLTQGPPPRSDGNTSLLRQMLVPHGAHEDVRCRYNPKTTAGPAKICQCFTLQLNTQLLIGIIGIQDLRSRTIGSKLIDHIIKRGLIHARDNVGESLSILLC